MTILSDHDLTQAIFRETLARQTVETLLQLRAMLARVPNHAGVRMVDDELTRRGEPVTASTPQGDQ